MIYALITLILFILFCGVLVIAIAPIANTTRYAFKNIWHKGLYALCGIVELACVAGIIYGVIWDIVTEIKIDTWNAIWIGVLLLGGTYLIYKFHTAIYAIIDKFFGN